MVVTKWAPFQELDSMERRLRRIFEEAGLAPKLLPAADIYETDDRFVVELEVPGFEEQDLGVEITDHTLKVTGSRHEDTEQEERAFRLKERLDRTRWRRRGRSSCSRATAAPARCTSKATPPAPKPTRSSRFGRRTAVRHRSSPERPRSKSCRAPAATSYEPACKGLTASICSKQFGGFRRGRARPCPPL